MKYKYLELINRTTWLAALVLAAIVGITACTPNAGETTVLQTTANSQAEATTGTIAASSSTTAVNETIQPVIQLIKPADAKKMLESNKSVILLDVRTEEEYQSGHIPGSQLLPYDEISSRLSELPSQKNTPIMVYCRSGRRSAIAASELAGLGYTEIYDLGGIQDWPYEITS